MAKAIREKCCGAVVFKRKGSKINVLIVRQLAGHWGFPKGQQKPGENEHETTVREVFEETGVEIEFLDDFREETHYISRTGYAKDVVYFMAKRTGGKEEPQPEEISEVKWVSLTEAIMLLTYDFDAVILRKALRFMKDNEIEEFSDSL